MKGSLHTDELMREVTPRRRACGRAPDQPCLRHGRARPRRDAVHHGRRDQHLPRPRCQAGHRPERDRPLLRRSGLGEPRVAILSAVETVTTKIPSTIEAAALCKMADRGQITGGLLDGPLAFDNAIDPEAARIKGIGSPVAGRAQILVVPDLEAGNMLAKNLTFLTHADAAGHRAGRAGADRPDVAGGFGARAPRLLRGRLALRGGAPARPLRSRGADGGDPRHQRRLVEPEVPGLRASRRRAERRCAGRSTASACARGCGRPRRRARAGRPDLRPEEVPTCPRRCE
jgi:hypothetical protein